MADSDNNGHENYDEIKKQIYSFIDRLNDWKNAIETQNINTKDIEENRAFLICLCELIIANHRHSPSVSNYDISIRFPVTVDDDKKSLNGFKNYNRNKSRIENGWISNLPMDIIETMRYKSGPDVFYIGDALIKIVDIIEKYLKECKNVMNPFDEFRDYIVSDYNEIPVEWLTTNHEIENKEKYTEERKREKEYDSSFMNEGSVDSFINILKNDNNQKN